MPTKNLHRDAKELAKQVLDGTYDFKAEDERLKQIVDEITKPGTIRTKKTNRMSQTINSTWIDSSIYEAEESVDKFKTQTAWRASVDTDDSIINYKTI